MAGRRDLGMTMYPADNAGCNFGIATTSEELGGFVPRLPQFGGTDRTEHYLQTYISC